MKEEWTDDLNKSNAQYRFRLWLD